MGAQPHEIMASGHFLYKLFFDGSGSTSSSLRTLYCCCARHDDWNAIETLWRETLSGTPPKYLHMKDAVAGQRDYLGWDKVQVGDRLGKLLRGLRTLQPPTLRAFAITLEVEAFESWRERLDLPPKPERVCVEWGFYRAIEEVQRAVPNIQPKGIEAYFDRNERYLEHVHSEWQQKRKDSADWRSPLLKLVGAIAAIDMKGSPGIQVADMFAWSTNRLYQSPGVGPARIEAFRRDYTRLPPKLNV